MGIGSLTPATSKLASVTVAGANDERRLSEQELWQRQAYEHHQSLDRIMRIAR